MDIRTTTPGRRAVLTAGAGLAAAAVVGVERLWPGGNSAAHDAAFRTVADTTTGCTTLTPTVTEGPFWVDERLNRADLRSDRDGTDVQAGVPLTFTMTLVDAGDGCTPQAGAYVDVWHANAQGAYSAVSGMGNPDNRAYDWLRGYQVSDADGKVAFTTIWPGYYRGRTIHLHFRIRTALDDATVDFTSQLFMDETNNALVLGTEAYQQQSARDTTNARDSIYLASLLMPVTGSTLAGYTGSFTVNLDFQDADVTPTPTASPTPTETTTPNPSPTTPTTGPTPTATPADTVVQAAATSATSYRRGRRRRARMSWTNEEKVSATIRLRRGDDVLAQHHLGRVGHGKHSSVLAVPSAVSAGRARLEIVVKDGAGNVKILRRTVTVPR